ncbi:two component, sigma54 specific, transcriptional regulator, Fis family [Magnetococcus marinus MC-1]|uniref:Two component, sigma54 specific, transcriptional regulator, Fis family n=1 Tax=Magnetococcus marinus (strain ATCC BAA-1437 / JCM 17883 / MC-1) TaxID=156889 RepID=A0L5M1_MAGMM|nr:sigma-54 dependent transcriptional regulator [Magnetococcus marinus]ABK43264.1 two component, sigma54 specific, transcriptional regulator, Fis family [Magnetococcus marinus MC-1]
MSHTILIVDDESAIRTSLRGILEDESYRVVEAASAEDALQLLAETPVSAIMLDIWMKGMDGIEALRCIKGMEGAQDVELPTHNREVPVIMMSGHGTIDTAVQATRLGAYDFLEKPLSLDRVLLLLDRAIREWGLRRENRALRARMDHADVLVGSSPAMQRLEAQIQRVAPTDGWVLINGEIGSGKEVVARRIHALSKRAQGPFIGVNSATIPDERIETALFGQGGNAKEDSRGLLEQGHQGTLFLDEISDMSLPAQARILRLLQEQRFERVGGGHIIQVDVRVIAATNRDLSQEMAQGRFREDLYYRLNVVPLDVPPLRERREDIPALVNHFLLSGMGSHDRTFTPEALALLQAYRWPGNVRELRNLVERLAIMAPQAQIGADDLPSFVAPQREKRQNCPEVGPIAQLLNTNLRDAREQFEILYLQAKLKANDGNISRTAEEVGMQRTAFHRKLKTLGITS